MTSWAFRQTEGFDLGRFRLGAGWQAPWTYTPGDQLIAEHARSHLRAVEGLYSTE